MYLPVSIQNSTRVTVLRLMSTCILLLTVGISQAAPKVFKAVVLEDVSIERVYEVRDIDFTITKAETNDTFLEDGVISGIVGLDAVTGRLIIEINQLSKAGMSMQAVGYVEDDDKQKGVAGCTLWQTRMFEESKLCYAAEIKKGKELKVILSVDDENVLPPVAEQ